MASFLSMYWYIILLSPWKVLKQMYMQQKEAIYYLAGRFFHLPVPLAGEPRSGFTALSGVDTFCTKAHSSLGHRTRLLPEGYDGWTLQWHIILAYNFLNRWTWHIQLSGNSTQAWTRLVEVHNSLPDRLADFVLISDFDKK